MADDAPRFLRSDAMPAPAGHWLQAMHPVWPPAIIATGFAVLAAGGVALAIVVGAPWWAYLLAVLWGGIMALIAMAYWSVFQAARKPSNWLLRADDSGLFIKIRSYRNHAIRSDEPDVLVLPRRSVTWLRRQLRTVNRRDSDNNWSRQRTHILDIKLADDAWLDAIGAQLKVERGLWAEGGRSRSRHGHYPVSVGDGVVQVAWRDLADSARPKLPRALAELARWYRIEADSTTAEHPAGVASSKEQEDQIVALLQAGETIQAVKLTRELYGLGLKDAKDFVDQLRGR